MNNNDPGYKYQITYLPVCMSSAVKCSSLVQVLCYKHCKISAVMLRGCNACHNAKGSGARSIQLHKTSCNLCYMISSLSVR